MQKLIRHIKNAVLLRKSGGIVQCEECGNVVGYIYEFNYEYLNFMFVCNCGTVGKVEIYKKELPDLKYPERPLYQKDNIHICQNCERPLFWVKPGGSENYVFSVICKCGVEYDMKYIKE